VPLESERDRGEVSLGGILDRAGIAAPVAIATDRRASSSRTYASRAGQPFFVEPRSRVHP